MYLEIKHNLIKNFKKKFSIQNKKTGFETVNDIYFCVEAGADGIVSPMVKSQFL